MVVNDTPNGSSSQFPCKSPSYPASKHIHSDIISRRTLRSLGKALYPLPTATFFQPNPIYYFYQKQMFTIWWIWWDVLLHCLDSMPIPFNLLISLFFEALKLFLPNPYILN
jgi:hypothetical protein